MAHNHSTGVGEAGTQFGALSVAVLVVGAHARVASQGIACGGGGEESDLGAGHLASVVARFYFPVICRQIFSVLL